VYFIGESAGDAVSVLPVVVPAPGVLGAGVSFEHAGRATIRRASASLDGINVFPGIRLVRASVGEARYDRSQAGSRIVGRIIDAQFGGRAPNDRFCIACAERYPRGSTLCPRCGGGLVLWATFAATDRKRGKRDRWLSLAGLVVAGLFVLVAYLLR
jgi:hypothetical protein